MAKPKKTKEPPEPKGLWWNCTNTWCREQGFVPNELPMAMWPPCCGFCGWRLKPPEPAAETAGLANQDVVGE